jgi:hypothetical protein
MARNPVTTADAKAALARNNDDVATPQPQPNQSAPASDGSPVRRLPDEVGIQAPYSDITEYLRAQDRVILDTVRLTQFT